MEAFLKQHPYKVIGCIVLLAMLGDYLFGI